MLNRIVIMGRLTRDPELRYTQSNIPVCSITVAVDRDFAPQGEQRQTDFIDVVAWRQAGEFISKYFTKGRMIYVDGRLQSRKWTDKEGNNRTSWEINADQVGFCGDKPAEDQQGTQQGGYQQQGGYAPAAPAQQQYQTYGTGNPPYQPPYQNTAQQVPPQWQTPAQQAPQQAPRYPEPAPATQTTMQPPPEQKPRYSAPTGPLPNVTSFDELEDESQDKVPF